MGFYPFAPSLSGAALQPWQFKPETYGAKGDGRVTGDVTTAGTTTYTSPTISADANAIGKWVMIHGANGNLNGPVIGKILSASAGLGTFTLAASAAASVANCPAVWGTDDAPAMVTMSAAMGTYATTFNPAQAGSGNYMAEALLTSIYILATLTQVGNGSSTPTFNTQFPLPYPNANGSTPLLNLVLTGNGGGGGQLQYWQSLIPNVTATALVSMLNPSSAAANDPTFGRQSILGGPSGAAGFTGGYANTKVDVKGVAIWTAHYGNLIPFDFGALKAARREQCLSCSFAPTGVNGSAVLPYQKNITDTPFLNSTSIGYRSPVSGNNLDVADYDCAAQGMEIGFLVFDHYAFWPIQTNYCDVAMKNDGSQGSSGTQHGLFGHARMENYNGGLRTNGGLFQIYIIWDSENAGVPNYDVNDAGPALFGDFIFGDKVDNRAPIISGAANLKVLNQNLPPGHWAAPPAVPATTVAQQNTAWRDAWISVHCGAGVTVSVINVDGTVTGLTVAASTSVAVRVPSGKNITLTFAGGTPTWDWWLD